MFFIVRRCKDYQKGGPVNIKLISDLSNSDRREIQLKLLGPQVDQGFVKTGCRTYLEGLLFYIQMQARWSKALHTKTASGFVGKRWTLRAAGQMTKPLAELFFGLVGHVRKLK